MNSAGYVGNADYYDTDGSTDGVEAVLGSDYIYTFTIIDNEIEPYLKFEADKTANESNSGVSNELISVSLVDAAGNIYQSEKTISVGYELDTDQGESEADYTSSSLDVNGDQNKYSDDFAFTSASLTFSGKTYAYNSSTSSYTMTDGETSKEFKNTNKKK